MRLAYTDEQEAMRTELRDYYAKLLDPETRAALHEDSQGPVYRRVVKQMAADGWLGVGWPKEYGGQGRTAIEQFIFFDETMRAGAPIPMLTINTVGPTIMHYGNDQQKEFFLPKILAGDIHFAIGYSEPGAGTDLANLRTRAVRDGDDYVINGQKLWTSLAATSDYVLACRSHRSGRQEAPRAFHHLRSARQPGHQHDAAAPDRRKPHLCGALRRRARLGRHAHRRARTTAGA